MNKLFKTGDKIFLSYLNMRPSEQNDGQSYIQLFLGNQGHRDILRTFAAYCLYKPKGSK